MSLFIEEFEMEAERPRRRRGLGFFQVPRSRDGDRAPRRMRIPAKPALSGTQGIKAIQVVREQIARTGWDPEVRHIGSYMIAGRAEDYPEIAMERLRALLGRTVMGWEMEPGRTRSDVLELLDRAMAWRGAR